MRQPGRKYTRAHRFPFKHKRGRNAKTCLVFDEANAAIKSRVLTASGAASINMTEILQSGILYLAWSVRHTHSQIMEILTFKSVHTDYSSI